MKRNRIISFVAAAAMILGMLPGLGMEAKADTLSELFASSSGSLKSQENTGAVTSGPTERTTFKFDGPAQIYAIRTYHWQNGSGWENASFSVQKLDGTVVWSTDDVYGGTATGYESQGTVWWYAFPADLKLEANTNYVFVDSNSRTWSTNAANGNRGFVSFMMGRQGLPVTNYSGSSSSSTAKIDYRTVPGVYEGEYLNGDRTFTITIYLEITDCDANGSFTGTAHETTDDGSVWADYAVRGKVDLTTGDYTFEESPIASGGSGSGSGGWDDSYSFEGAYDGDAFDGTVAMSTGKNTYTLRRTSARPWEDDGSSNDPGGDDDFDNPGQIIREVPNQFDNDPQITVINNVIYIDVRTTDWFYDPVVWAVNNNVTTGTATTRVATATLREQRTFEPAKICDRAQAVTFLWRAAGEPVPRTTSTSFRDIGRNDYFYNAVLWAQENGITKGTSNTTFEPYKTVDRSEVVTFLMRLKAGRGSGSNPFIDVSSSDWFYDPVRWARVNNITQGSGAANTFRPRQACPRSDIVTFLYRAYQ